MRALGQHRNKSIAVCKCWSHNGPRKGSRNRRRPATVIFPRVRRLSVRLGAARDPRLHAREHRLTDVAQRHGIIAARGARRIVAVGAEQLCDRSTYAPRRASLLAINIPESCGKSSAARALDRIQSREITFHVCLRLYLRVWIDILLPGINPFTIEPVRRVVRLKRPGC